MDPRGTKFYDDLSACVDAFVTAWEAEGPPPEISSFLPKDDEALGVYALLELIKVDLEYRWSRGLGKRMNEYILDHPSLDGPDGPPTDLIYEEYLQRKRIGLDADPQEYLENFPERATALRGLFELGGTDLSTSIVANMPSDVPETGEQVDDFLLIDRLGRGAFATVFLARQRSMQRTVALKVSANRGEEAQTLAQLDHPNIVRVFDQRILEEEDLRLLYMEYVPAGGLDAVIKRVNETRPEERTGQLLLGVVNETLLSRGETPPRDSMLTERLAEATWAEAVCILGAQLARALGYAHRKGVLHRDVKPANVLLSRTGAAKLADFNISYSSEVEGSGPAAYMGGSMAYMSAEQLEACSPVHATKPADLDGRADMYSLAVLLFELLTGEMPLVEPDQLTGDWTSTIQRMISTRLEGVPEERAALLPSNAPALLWPTLRRALSPKPTDRFADADEMARQLELCLMPRAAELMLPPESARLVHGARREPLSRLLIAMVVPNAVLSVLNVLFNLDVVIPPEDHDAFMAFVMKVNGVAFGVGLFIAVRMCLPIVRASRRAAAGVQMDGPARAEVRRQMLRLPERIMFVIFPLWVLGGLSFPVWLSMEGMQRVGAWESFTGSNMLFGVLGATACYFLLMGTIVVWLLPPFLDVGKGTPEDRGRLRAVSRRAAVWFGVLTTVPFVSLILLALFNVKEPTPFLALGVIGTVAFVCAYIALLGIRRDVNALDEAIAPR